MKKITRLLFVLLAGVLTFASCEKGKSYADLLNEEDNAVKAFLSDKIVINKVPSDSVFVTLKDVGGDTLKVPYYRLESDGNVYMQVLDAGNLNDRFEKGDDVNIRFLRWDLKAMMNGENPSAVGNINPMDYVTIRFGETSLSSTTQYGTGIQYPMEFLGDECKVNMIIRAKMGFSSESSAVLPYFYNIRYYKSK